MSPDRPAAPDGLVVVDKPAGWTSHDVVARLRRLARTRRVGHAGTLDPMATGVLVVGVGRATRLLGHLALGDKSYRATVRLGAATVTDDAEGDVVSTTPAGHVTAAAVAEAVAALTGEIQQVPSAVSAVKVDGKRSYKRVRDGDTVALAPRPVTVARFDVLDLHRQDAFVDRDVEVDCSTGTYVRALARDLGEALGVGGHLTALRRTRVGGFTLEVAATLDALEHDLRVVPMAEAARAAFPVHEASPQEAQVLAHGGPVPATGEPGPVAVIGPDGTLLALVADAGSVARPLAVFVAG